MAPPRGSEDRASLAEGLRLAVGRSGRLGHARRLSVDAFAERYAAEHGLDFAPTGELAQTTRFTGAVITDSAHGFIRGPIGGGPDGALLYCERAPLIRHGSIIEGWTAALYGMDRLEQLAAELECRWRPPPRFGRGEGELPPPEGLREVQVGDEEFQLRYSVAVGGPRGESAAERLFTPEFVRWLTEQPVHKRSREDLTRFEWRRFTLCVYAKGTLSTTASLDRFAGQAARIAEQVQQLMSGADRSAN